MKETLHKLSEKQIALITLGLTLLALVVGIALPEIRAALGLDTPLQHSTEQAALVDAGAQPGLPTPPAPPGTRKPLARVEIKQDYANSGAQTGEFVVFSGVTFRNSGFLKGKVIIQKGATFKNTGAVEGEVVNQGGTFENSGYLDGPLTVE